MSAEKDPVNRLHHLSSLKAVTHPREPGPQVAQVLLNGLQHLGSRDREEVGLLGLDLEHSPAVRAANQFRTQEGYGVECRQRQEIHAEPAPAATEHHAVD